MLEANSSDGKNDLPLCVDLDGTLLKTDTLFESVACALRDGQTMIRLPFWLLGGKSRFKAKLSEHIKPNPALLPYNEFVLKHLHAEKKKGRYLILVTAANQSIARAINAHIGLFDEIIASSATRNLRGKEKADVLAERFGLRQFDYIGNDSTDLHVFRVARKGLLVNPSKHIEKRARTIDSTECLLANRPSDYKSIIKTIRPYQWVKNLLIFVPIVTSSSFGDLVAWRNAVVMFLAFCATSSGIYVINDIFDLEADRLHPDKRQRPFAGGSLPLVYGFVLFPILMATGIALAFATSQPFFVPGYAVISIAYTAKLKQVPLVDLFVLASLYTIRLFAGGEVTGYKVSLWLLAYSGFLFFSLAIIKRVAELKMILKASKKHSLRRGYEIQDIDLLQQMGISSSFVSSLVLALYTQSEMAQNTYRHPEVLWCTIPLLLFWQCRLWMSTSRNYMHSDPIVYAAKDWVSRLVGLCLIVILLMANANF